MITIIAVVVAVVTVTITAGANANAANANTNTTHIRLMIVRVVYAIHCRKIGKVRLVWIEIGRECGRWKTIC